MGKQKHEKQNNIAINNNDRIIDIYKNFLKN